MINSLTLLTLITEGSREVFPVPGEKVSVCAAVGGTLGLGTDGAWPCAHQGHCSAEFGPGEQSPFLYIQLLHQTHPEQQMRAGTKFHVTGILFSATEHFTASASTWMTRVD